MQAVIALLGGTVAAGAHVTKAGTRVAANASPEPFSNWILSFLGDGFVIGLAVITLKYPLVALAVSVAILIVIVLDPRTIWKWLKRRPNRSRQSRADRSLTDESALGRRPRKRSRISAGISTALNVPSGCSLTHTAVTVPCAITVSPRIMVWAHWMVRLVTFAISVRTSNSSSTRKRFLKSQCAEIRGHWCSRPSAAMRMPALRQIACSASSM